MENLVVNRCKCGCGKSVKSGNSFSMGHYCNRSEIWKKIYSNPEMRRKQSIVQKRIDLVDKRRNLMRNRNPMYRLEIRRKMSELLRGRTKSEEWKRNLRVAQNRPDVNQRRSSSLSRTQSLIKDKPEYREHRSKIATERILKNGVYSYGVWGHFYSEKSDKVLFYRSSYERRAFELLERNKYVLSYSNCMFSVCYMWNGFRHRYIPDIFVVFCEPTKPSVVEVKSLWEMKSEIFQRKFVALKDFCFYRGWDVELWTEKELGFTDSVFYMKCKKQYQEEEGD